MPSEYNPNSVWTSKKKKYVYKPTQGSVSPSSPRPPMGQEKPQEVTVIQGSPESDDFKKKIIIGSAIGILVIVGAFGLYLFLKPAPPLNIPITFTNPNQVLVGDPFVLSVSYQNNSQTILKNAKLDLALPAGVSVEGQAGDQRVVEQVLGDLGPGTASEQSFNLIVTGNPNSILQVAANLIYNTAASGNNTVESSAETNLVVGGPVMGLTITAPSNIFSGQNFDITVAYVNNAPHALGDVKVAMQFPPVFAFEDASIAADSAGNNEWDLGSLASGATGSFIITGNIVGQNQALYTIAGSAKTDYMGEVYTIANPTVGLQVAESPLTINGGLAKGADYVAGLDDSLEYDFSYTNNSNVTLQDAAITAQFTGAMFDFTTLATDGSFNSLTDTVTWSGANTPALLSIAPGQSGVVKVSVRTKSSFPIRLLSDKDYTLKANVEIESPTVPPNTAASSTVSLMDVQNDVGGEVALAAIGYYNDPSSAISNTGPYPPKVNKQTEYSIHWQVTNYSTDIANVSISAYLQSGTTCTGVITSGVSSTPVCDAATGEVTWTIPAIAATTGVTSHPIQAVFQVENTPAVNQVGQDVIILGPTTLQATDQFTGATLQASADAVKTNLPDDPSLGNGNRQVSQ